MRSPLASLAALLVVVLVLGSCGFVQDESIGLSATGARSSPAAPDASSSGGGATPSATGRSSTGATLPSPVPLGGSDGGVAGSAEQPPLPPLPADEFSVEQPGDAGWSPSVEEVGATEPGEASSPEVADLWWALGAVTSVKQSEGVFVLLADPGVPPDSPCFAAWRFLRHTLHLSSTPSSTVDMEVYSQRLESARRSLEQLIAVSSGRQAELARDVAAVLDRMSGLLGAGYGPDVVRSFGDSVIGAPGRLLDGLVEAIAYSCPTVATGRPTTPFFWAEES